MKRRVIAAAVAAVLLPATGVAADPLSALAKQWTYKHTSPGQTSEIVAFDSQSKTLWVAGIAGVDVLNASNGSFLQHISVSSAFGALGTGQINSVAIRNGVAAFAIERTTNSALGTNRTQPGMVQFYNTATRALTSGVNSITVGALPDMLKFTPNGSRLLVANEATPTTYGGFDPQGSVSIIDMSTRSVVATAGLAGVPTSGNNIRSPGMNYEPENIAVNAAGTKAYVSLQEHNAMGVLNLTTNSFEAIIGLGAKDFSLPGNRIDPLNGGGINLINVNAKGLYQPDGMATYQAGGKTYIVMANEGDFKENDSDRTTAGALLGAPSPLNNLRVFNTEGASLFTAGARSFSILSDDGSGNYIRVYDSGEQLDAKAIGKGIYDDGRSRDKGVEPEGVEIMTIAGRTLAFIGLERTLKGAVAVYDVTNPDQVSFLDMIVTDGDLAPEGLTGYEMDGVFYLAIANETSGTTTVYSLAPVPEPEIYAMMGLGLGLMGWVARKRKVSAA